MSELKNHLKINDFGQLQTDFDRLSEEIDKNKDSTVIFVQG